MPFICLSILEWWHYSLAFLCFCIEIGQFAYEWETSTHYAAYLPFHHHAGTSVKGEHAYIIHVIAFTKVKQLLML